MSCDVVVSGVRRGARPARVRNPQESLLAVIASRALHAHAICFLIIALGTLLAAARDAAADAETWLFNNSTNGWTTSAGTTATTSSSSLHVVFATGGGLFSAAFGFVPASGATHNYVRFGYRITDGNITQFKFNFKTAQRNNYSSTDYFMPVTADGNWHWPTFSVDQIGDWRSASSITQMRLIALTSSGGGASGTMDLDFFVLRLDDQVPGAPQIGTVTPGSWTNGGFTIPVSGNDPPPNGFNGSANPDKYGSGVSSFRWWVGGGATTTVGIAGYDLQEGTATADILVPTSSLSPGTNVFHVQSLDRVGFVGSSSPVTLLFDPNRPGPPTITSSPATWTNANAFHVAWTNPGDDLSGVDHFEWLVDDVFQGSTPDPFTDAWVPGAGDHRFQVYAVDGAGNAGVPSSTVHLLFDDVLPSVPGVPVASPPGYTNANSFDFAWSASTDGPSGVSRYQYRVDQGQAIDVPTTSVSGIKAPVPGSHQFAVRAVDVAGNSSDWATTNFFYWPDYLFPPALQSPADGPVSLPETFSWSAVPGATGYEIQIAPQGVFDGPLWSTTTTALTSVVVPASAAATTGSSYGWRVRALGSDPPSPWTATRAFVRVSGVSPPVAPVLLSPAAAAAVSGPAVLFQWAPVAGATSYQLQVSSDPAFGSGASTSWAQGNLTSTSKEVDFSDVALDLYWRVTAFNSAGAGGISPGRDVHLIAPAPGLSAATIISPSLDVTVEQGQGMLATGLITGRASGDALVEWLLDGEPFFTETIPLAGKGSETSPAPVPTSVLGPHTLQLRVTAGNQVFSPLRSVDVATPGFGAPAEIVLVADEPQLLQGEATNLYAVVRDEDGAIILTDNGRHLHFDPIDGGSVSPSDAIDLGGVALTSFTAPAVEAQPQVQVSEVSGKPMERPAGGSLPGATVQLGVSSAELQRQQQVAYSYLRRLGNLNWDGIPDVAGTNLPGSFSVGPALNFVNHARVGDEARLRRFNLFLRLIDRAFFYDSRVNGYGTRESGAIWGAATLHADEVNSIGKILLSLVAFVDKLDQSSSKLPFWQKVQAAAERLAMKWIVDGLDWVIRHVIDWSNISYAEKTAAHGWWDRCKSLARESVGYKRSESIVGILADVTFVVTMTKWSVDNGYTKQVQPVLDQVVTTLSNPGWSGGSDARATQAVESALAEIRTKTAQQHLKYQSTMTAFNRLKFFNDLQSVAASFGWWGFINNVFNRSIQNLIIWATGFDCGTIAGRIPPFIAVKTNDILAYQSPSNAPAWQAARLAPVQSSRAPVPARLVTTPAMQAAFVQANDDAVAFETAARDLETALLASDASGAEAAFNTIASVEQSLADDDQRAEAPMLSAVEQGRLEIGGMLDDGAVLALGAQRSVSDRIRALGATSDWLSSPTDDGLRLAALDSLRAALETSRTGVDGFISYAPKVIGTEAVPYLVLDSPTGPAAIVVGGDAAIEVTVHNLGAGTAHGASLVMTGPGVFASFPAGDRRDIGDLAPGESRIARWQVHAVPSLADSDSSATVYLSIHNDGGDALGGGRSFGLQVVRSGAVLDVPRDGAVRRFDVAPPRPNPARGSVTIEYSLPAHSDVTTDIVDLAGRRVAHIERRGEGQGMHSVIWNTRSSVGELVPAGAYFVRVRAESGTLVRRFTILR